MNKDSPIVAEVSGHFKQLFTAPSFVRPLYEPYVINLSVRLKPTQRYLKKVTNLVLPDIDEDAWENRIGRLIPVERRRVHGTTGGKGPGINACPDCGKIYNYYRSLHRHMKYECGQAPRFYCPYCNYIKKQRSQVYSHIKIKHPSQAVYALDTQQQE